MMMRTLLRLTALFLTLVLAACNATPLPQPPSIDSARLELRAVENGSLLIGEDGAVTGFVGEIRVTSGEGRRTVPVGADGEFRTLVPGAMIADLHFLELLEAEGARFILAVRDEGGATVEVDVPDGDEDGSPDAIDCAPSDETLRAQECMCVPGTENCDGLDEDCDGFIDEECGACVSAADCAMGEMCLEGLCR